LKNARQTGKGTIGSPPKWADHFLEWYCNPVLLEEIQGDAHELFRRKAKTSAFRARWQFVWNVLRFFRWRNIRKDRFKDLSPLKASMFKSYLVTGFRNMVRNATPSIINVTGLSIALACAVLVFILEDSYYNLDSMHEKRDRISLIVNHVKEGDGIEKRARSPYPLAEALRENAAVEKSVRALRASAAVRVGDKVFNEPILYTDPGFLDVFSFEVLKGSQSGRNKNSVMLSKSMAIKYFGNADVIGQPISFKFTEQNKQEFVIGAVFEDTPPNSSMYFDFLVPIAVWEEMNKHLIDNWAQDAAVTFVLLKPGSDHGQLAPTLERYKKLQNQASLANPIQAIEPLPLELVSRRSFDIKGSLSWTNAPASMVALAVIATLLILLACFNYMNVAVASVTTRLKEIGIRKVIGGGRREIIHQFLAENMLLCFLALVAGTALAYYFLVPAFDSLFPIKIAFEISSLKTAVIFFGGLLLIVALLSGAYPAFYVSSFNAVKILHGRERFGSKSFFSKVLLTFQFTLSIITIVGSLVFVWTSKYFEGKDWGYDRNETMMVRLQDARQFGPLRDAMLAKKNVVSCAGAAEHIGRGYQAKTVSYRGQEYSVVVFPVGFNYAESMNLRLVAGRFPDENIASDKTDNVIVNEAFVKKMGWQYPLKESFMLDGVKRFVIGVVADFYYDNFYFQVQPVVMAITPAETFRYMVLKTDAGSLRVTYDILKETWQKNAPDDPFDGLLQQDVFDYFINNLRANNTVTLFLAGITVFLAAMGLYGLVSYNLTRRLKEFSVRKVFGASMFEIFRLMNKDYLWIVLVAFAVGAPFGAYLMTLMIRSIYPEAIPRSSMPYVIAISVMVAVVALTVSLQLFRLTRENTAQTLKVE
jgi:putative ABC transport system permease protein